MVWQLADEPDRIGEYRNRLVVQGSSPQLGVEGGEQTVLHWRIGPGQRIEQRRLACIGVAGQGDLVDRSAPFALQLTRPFDLPEVLLQVLDTPTKHSAIDLELGLSFSTPDSDAPYLPREMGPSSGQSGQQILEASQLDLCSGLAGPSSLDKDLQYQTTAIDDLAVDDLFQILDLTGREVVVEDHQVSPQGPRRLSDLFGLAATDQRSGVRCLPSLHSPPGDSDTRAERQFRQLVEVLLDQPTGLAGEDQTDQERGACLIQ